MTLLRGQDSWAKMMSPGGKLTAQACHPTKKVNKAVELTYLSSNWSSPDGVSTKTRFVFNHRYLKRKLFSVFNINRVLGPQLSNVIISR